MALRYSNIASFEMIRDGETIEPRAALPDVGNEPVYSGEACFDLRIVIYTGDGVKTVLPFIDTPAGYDYAYTCAVKAAYEVASVLEDLLRKRQGDNTIPAY